MGKKKNTKGRRAQKPKQKYPRSTAPERVLSAKEQLRKAKEDRDLPSVDLHGYFLVEVGAAISQLLEENPGEYVRIYHGSGTGKVAEEVQKYLRTQVNGKKALVDEYVKDSETHSVVVKVR